MASTHLQDIRELFERYDKDHDDNLTLNELNELLTGVARTITALPSARHFAYEPFNIEELTLLHFIRPLK